MAPTAQERDATQVHRQWYSLLAGPLVWTVYFLVAYGLADFGCRGGWLTGTLAGWPAASVVVVALTAAALTVAGMTTWRAYSRWRRLGRRGGSEAVWPRAEERSRFMLLSSVLLGVLFSVLILFTGLPALLLEPCLPY